MSGRSISALLLCAVSATSCGAVQDLLGFELCADEQLFEISAAELGAMTPGGMVPEVPCANDAVCGAAGLGCGGMKYSCAPRCAAGRCELRGRFEEKAPVDLSQAVKNRTSAAALSTVTVRSIKLAVKENTLSFAVEPITLAVGPMSASKLAEGTVFTTAPTIPAGQTFERTLETTEAGKEALSGFVKAYRTPFSMLAGTDLVLKGGSRAPSGRLALGITACFSIEVF